MSELIGNSPGINLFIEETGAENAYRDAVLDAMAHPEQNITVDAQHQPHLTPLLKRGLELAIQSIRIGLYNNQTAHDLYQKAKAGAYKDPKGTFVLVKLDECDGRDFKSVLQKVSQAYDRAWGGAFRVDEEATRKIYQENPNAAFLDPGRQALYNMVRDMDRRITDNYKALFTAVSCAPDYAANDTELLEQLRLYAGCLNECPDPFGPYLTLIRPMHEVFGTRVGDNAPHVLNDINDYAGIFITPALGKE